MELKPRFNPPSSLLLPVSAEFIMAKKIVLKVSIMCVKCKICVMSIISKFEGVQSIALDADKNTATIVGDVDAVLVVKELRKKKRPATIDSVGENKKEEKKKDEKEELCKKLAECCNACRTPAVWVIDEPTVCTIL